MKTKVRISSLCWIGVLFLILVGLIIRTVFSGFRFTAYICWGCAGVLTCYLLLPHLAKKKPRIARALLLVLSFGLGIGMIAAAVTGAILVRSWGGQIKACDYVVVLGAVNIHAETDCRSEKLGYKIREAQMQKIPYMLVIGDRDMENGTVSVRTRKGEDLGAMTPDEFIAKCLLEIATKSKEV